MVRRGIRDKVVLLFVVFILPVCMMLFVTLLLEGFGCVMEGSI